ncbi:MAG TPA: D-2-hydroxyacid dehydrogenase [Dongiaceae bacterium]|nr:D-2-hydroxyacid dehydrogenase [Dongiaceae bacterium]
MNRGSGKLRVLIERPSTVDQDVKRSKADFNAVARRHPEVMAKLRVQFCATDEERERMLARAEVFVGWEFPAADLARRAPHLRWIQLTGAGVEHLFPFDWMPPGLLLTNCSGVHGPKVAEFATMALLMLNAHIPALLTAQRAHRWDRLASSRIEGRVAVVVGLGGMGSAVARAARRLRLRVIGVSRSGRPRRFCERTLPVDRLTEVLPEADFLFLAAPLTPESRGLVGRAELARLRPGAGLVNVGRGGLVDEAALARALRRGELAGAILDVFATEPLPADSPLWDTPNLVIVPHVSSDDARAYMPRNYELFFRNCRRFLDGRPLLNRVDVRLGY